jgi:type VI secretion system protein ImpL
MKDTLQKVVKVFLIISAAVLVLLLVLGVVLVFDWPWWVGLFLVLLLTGLVIAGFFPSYNSATKT